MEDKNGRKTVTSWYVGQPEASKGDMRKTLTDWYLYVPTTECWARKQNGCPCHFEARAESDALHKHEWTDGRTDARHGDSPHHHKSLQTTATVATEPQFPTLLLHGCAIGLSHYQTAVSQHTTVTKQLHLLHVSDTETPRHGDTETLTERQTTLGTKRQ